MSEQDSSHVQIRIRACAETGINLSEDRPAEHNSAAHRCWWHGSYPGIQQPPALCDSADADFCVNALVKIEHLAAW